VDLHDPLCNQLRSFSWENTKDGNSICSSAAIADKSFDIHSNLLVHIIEVPMSTSDAELKSRIDNREAWQVSRGVGKKESSPQGDFSSVRISFLSTLHSVARKHVSL